jgi:hypothetical protein
LRRSISPRAERVEVDDPSGGELRLASAVPVRSAPTTARITWSPSGTASSRRIACSPAVARRSRRMASSPLPRVEHRAISPVGANAVAEGKAVSNVAHRSSRSLAGIVNLAAHGMLVVSVARRVGSENPLPAYCAARPDRAEPEKGALSPLS